MCGKWFISRAWVSITVVHRFGIHKRRNVVYSVDMPSVYSVDLPPPRDRILEAAERLLRSDGMAALTTRRVAAEVGVTAMAIYRHFRDKEDLVEALVRIGFRRWEKRLADAVAAQHPHTRIENALRAYREFALDEPRLFELMFLVPRRTAPLAPETLRAATSPSFAAVTNAVQEAVAAGDFAEGDPGRIVLLFWALAHGLIALHLTGRFGFDATLFRRRYDETIEMQLSRLTAPGDRA